MANPCSQGPPATVPPAQAGIGSWNANRTAQFRNGAWGALAGDRSIIGARAVDMLVVLLPVVSVATSAAKGSGSIGAEILVGILAWLLFPWFYGLCCAAGTERKHHVSVGKAATRALQQGRP